MTGGLALVRTLGSPRRVQTAVEVEDFEQELIDQFCLASVGAGMGDEHVEADRATVFEFVRFCRRPVWTADQTTADRFLTHLRVERGNARSTVQQKAMRVARFFEFLIARHQGDIHALTGVVVGQPIDEFNRPAKAHDLSVRVPPSESEIDDLFGGWRDALPAARKYLPAARDYLAASLWRRAGLRINETVMLDIDDWRRDLGGHGKLHVRFGKGSRGRGSKVRLVPGINDVDVLLEWWLSEVRHQFGDDWQRSGAPLLPSERRDRDTGMVLRVGPEALRAGLAHGVERWLPSWSGRLTPHGLRHFCASSLYQRGVDLKAIQDLLGHNWLSTTTRYIHVHADHIEQAWTTANTRVTPGSSRGDAMRWNLRMTAAERGIWKSTELRRRLAEAGLQMSAGKMSALWTGTPTTIRLDDLDVICSVLACMPSDLLIPEPDLVAARRPPDPAVAVGRGRRSVAPIRPGRNRSRPPA